MTSYSDNFNRTDTNTLGGNWTEHGDSQAAQIKDNQLRMVESTTVKGYAYYSATVGADQFSQLTYVADDALNGPAVRIDSAGDETNATMYLAMCDAAGGNIHLYKFVGVSFEESLGTQIGTAAYSWVGGEDVRIEANGTTIKVLIDGVEKISVTDSAISSGYFGCGAPLKASGFSDFGDWDDWSGGDLETLSGSDSMGSLDAADHVLFTYVQESAESAV